MHCITTNIYATFKVYDVRNARRDFTVRCNRVFTFYYDNVRTIKLKASDEIWVNVFYDYGGVIRKYFVRQFRSFLAIVFVLSAWRKCDFKRTKIFISLSKCQVNSLAGKNENNLIFIYRSSMPVTNAYLYLRFVFTKYDDE